MTDIQQRITDILWGTSREGSIDVRNMRHVAEVITTELGLTQEWAIETARGGISKSRSEESARRVEQKYPGEFFAITRYVTPWEPAP